MDKVKYWIDTAEEDVVTADALFEKKRYLWMGFICHLIVEKAFKAVIATHDIIPPKIHVLGKLAQLGGVLDKLSTEQLSVMATLDTMQIEARYPAYKKAIEQSMTPENSRVLLANTKELLAWIKMQL